MRQPSNIPAAPNQAMRCSTLVSMVTCWPKLSAAGMPGASVPGILLRIFLQNCRMSLQDVSRSFSRTARLAFSWPACRKARSRPTSTAMQSRALWVNCRKKEQEVTADAIGTGPRRRRRLLPHPDVVRQLQGAVLGLLRQVDAVQVLRGGRDGDGGQQPTRVTPAAAKR